jgi:hypothetical protein
MSKLIQRLVGACAMLLGGVSALTAVANPGGGTAVVIDRPDSPDLIIQELRAENSDATHVPIKVRVTIPADGPRFRSARLVAYLTATTDPEADRVAERVVEIEAQWANRSIIIDVPSPGEGSYFAHVEGELWLEGRGPMIMASSSTERVRFGQTKNCKSVRVVTIPTVARESCPVLFDNKATDIVSRNNKASNRKVLGAAVERINELCENGSLHRVSVRGWASLKNSFDPTNEELARGRAATVVSALRGKVAGCAGQIYDDSEPGTGAVTDRFGREEKNRCAEIQITSHTCDN